MKARVYGVRYPEQALKLLKEAGIEYGGWLPNFEVPKVFSKFRLTVHIPRRPYATVLPGIPTIRPFEALACGIPLISAPWEDSDRLFSPGKDFLYAKNGAEMKKQMHMLLEQPEKARQMALHGHATIQEHHTCGHRVDELLDICTKLGIDSVDPLNGKISDLA